MTNRIDRCFATLRARGRKGLVPFVTAGDPHPDQTVAILRALVESGADLLELGVPFSDPMADGPVIQRSSERALKHGITLKQVIGYVAEFRKKDAHTPVVLFGYANPVEAIGQERFADAAKTAGADGVLIVDYPPEEASEWLDALAGSGIDPIFLLSPTSSDARIARVAAVARGYIYYVSLKGVTGASNIDTTDVESMVRRIRARTSIPVGVGFGIRDAETARRVGEVADAVVIGSRIVQEVASGPVELAAERAGRLVAQFRAAMDAQKAPVA